MNDKSKTILFVMSRLPFPASSGRKTSLYHYCRILSEDFGYRLVVAAFLEAGDGPNNKPDFIDRLIILPKASAKTRIFGILKESIIFHKKPMQVSLYWSPKAKTIINTLVTEEKPIYVIGDMVRSTEYIKDVDAVRIADLDDRISLRYQRQLETDIHGINPYGAFLNTMPKAIQNLMLIKPLKVLVVKNEIDLLKKYELEIGKICDKTVFVAKKEAQEFNRELGAEKAFAVPIGVDIEYFDYRSTGKNGNIIGFLGAMSVAHNENAAKHFITNILPQVLDKVSDAKFLVIGGGASENLLKLKSAHVDFTGRVEDVRDYLEKCKVFVCPMTFGSGIKTKNLEAMAMGLPVVTTSIGAENINAADGEDWILADDDDKFADGVVEILTDDVKRVNMGRNGCEFIKKNFTWEVAEEEFRDLFDRLY